MGDFNPSMYDEDDDLVEILKFWQLSDQSVIERRASLSDIPLVLKDQVAGAAYNSNGADLHMDMPPPLDYSLSANYCDFQTLDPISSLNRDVCVENENLPTSGFEDLLELDNANLPTLDYVQTMGSQELLKMDNAILPTLDWSEDLVESKNHAISLIISPERAQDKEAKNVIHENQQRNNASLVLSDHSLAVVAVIGKPPLRQVLATIPENPPPDGYNWRKYGQKPVKNSMFSRSYYRCSQYPICKVTKKIEYSTEGSVAEIIYKGSHNHPKANPFRDQVSKYLTKQMAVNDCSSNKRNLDNVEMSSSARSACQPKYTISIESNCHEVFDDGFRWRKYGQKVVKGNSNPRSYYKCAHSECRVKKHIERAPNNIKLVLTTYEGRHEHELPATRNNMNNNLNYVVTPSLNLGGLRLSSNHHNQANNMVLEARVEAPTMANQERFTWFEFPDPINMVPPGTISTDQWASANVSFGSTIMPFAGLHGPPLTDSRIVQMIHTGELPHTEEGNGHNANVECTQELIASSLNSGPLNHQDQL